MKFNVQWFLDLFPTVFMALGITFKVALWTLFFTIILSAFMAVIRYFKVKGLSQFFTGFITIFRATPLVAQLFFLYFGLPIVFPIFMNMDPTQATIIALTFNASAFMAENFRAALNSVDKSQLEACYSMGMTNVQTMTRVVMPQAFVIALPSMGNEFIGIIKGTSLGFTVGLLDIMAVAKMEGTLYLRFFESYLCVIIFYVVIVLIIEQGQKYIEKKVKNFY
ncbi:MAG: amino acid ABC transporter permease [Clostridium sp.]